MRKFINSVVIRGLLVTHSLEESTYDKNGETVECIRGEMVIRTADDGEHPVKFFSNRFKNDGTESKAYSALRTVINEYKTLENYPDDADYVEVTLGSFGVNDYVSKNSGEVVTINTVTSNFISRIDKTKLDVTPMTAKFEVEGVIANIADEIIKNEPTGNIVVTINVINQLSEGKGKDAKYSVKDMFPLKLIVTSDMADAFRGIYSEGMFVKYCGNLINRAEVKTVVEKQAFGGDVTKTFTNTTRRNEITSGSDPISIYEVELTDDICNQLISQRKAKIAEVMNGNNKSGFGGTAPATTTTTSANPFANKNPFAK